MKKGFTMIELIFVIVILGILASVAIPRLAATKTDAETSAAIGNIRTLISDASAYYVAQGAFGKATFQQVTNVKVASSGSELTTGTDLGGSKNDCFNIVFKEAVVGNDGKLTTPALATVTKKGNDTICAQMAGADAIKALIEAKYDGKNTGIAIGSGTSIYGGGTTTTTGNGGGQQ